MALALVTPLLAGNYVAITVFPGPNGGIVTYTYTIALTAGPLSYTTSGVVSAPGVPFSTEIPIEQTPTIPFPADVIGAVTVTANSNGVLASGSDTFTLHLVPDETATATVNITLSNGGQLSATVVVYAAKLSIPFAGIAALGFAAILGKRMRRSSKQ